MNQLLIFKSAIRIFLKLVIQYAFETPSQLGTSPAEASSPVSIIHSPFATIQILRQLINQLPFRQISINPIICPPMRLHSSYKQIIHAWLESKSSNLNNVSKSEDLDSNLYQHSCSRKFKSSFRVQIYQFGICQICEFMI